MAPGAVNKAFARTTGSAPLWRAFPVIAMRRLKPWFRAATVGLAVAGVWPVAAQIPVQVHVTNNPGFAVPADFAGLSFEIGTQRAGRGGVAGYIFSPTNTPVVTLFQNVGVRSLRIGGGTVDGKSAVLLSNAQIDSLFAFAGAVGNLNIIYTLQLENGNASTDAATAQYIWQNYWAQLSNFAIGNEPDWKSYSYPPYGTGSDPAITGYASYLADWQSFSSAVLNVAPGVTFSGPDTGNNIDEGEPDGPTGHWAANGTEWTTSFADDEGNSPSVTLITQHDYEANGVTQTNAAAFIDAMLSSQWDTITNQTLYEAMGAPLVAAGLPYRFTEANEEVGGLAGASGTFASGLWALNFMHWWAAHGCEGVNFHNKPWLLTDTIFYDAAGNYEVYPKGYAIKAFTLGSQGREEPVELVNPNNLNVSAYAVAGATNLCVTFLNKEHETNALAAAVALQLGGFLPWGGAQAMWLIAPGNSVTASNGITLGGATITNNSAWNGQWTPLVPLTNNQLNLTVPATSAVLVNIVLSALPQIGVATSASGAVLTFNGTLVAATNLDGIYTPVANAIAPAYAVPLTNTPMFYRARTP
jgi:hypothetical protein